jgi:radical SAM enzyme (TIGR01210 family)
VLPVANVLLGAPFLTEAEALASAVDSLRWALEAGTHLCVLFPANVKRWTLQHWLWERGLYHSPSLWSLIEAVHALGPELARRVLLSWYSAAITDAENPSQVSDPVLAVPTTCPACHAEVAGQLARYCATGDFAVIEELRRSPCACREEWRARVAAPPERPLFDRVTDAYRTIGEEVVGHEWWSPRAGRLLGLLDEGRAGADALTGAALAVAG